MNSAPAEPGLTDADYLRLTETWAGALFEIATGNEHVDVPSCPGWQLRHLVHHMGNVAYFVDAVIEAAGPEPEFTDAELPADAEVCAWADERTSALLHRLRGLDPETRVWNWSREPARLRFWPRCLAHEALVHAWDAYTALGRPVRLPLRGCLDGIGEVLDIHLPLRTGEVMTGRWTAEVRTDEGPCWHRAIEEGTVRALDTDPEPDVLLHGGAEQLYLGLWGRIPLTGARGTENRIAALRTG
ncbi:maleylpyruvate isomerase family mycothiol-dependent enzyme [Sciscionella sediminilitoris]|uniref:maleylpyruvate isomerase family mycothiol-dependent enzyme n=1 Tax=Sciscionella sediminilitoris TaxID=1445613 RepID=UPI0004DF1864|nr:maleylpyruvate isomerase family mycothiol-dependent enzyme [Sciscionella sp. SE31]